MTLRGLLHTILMLPVAAGMVAFAVANRRPVTLSLDPFEPDLPAYVLTVPLYLLGFALLFLGVLLGGFAAWLGQAKWRRACSSLATKLSAAQAELEEARRQTRAARTLTAPPAEKARSPARSHLGS